MDKKWFVGRIVEESEDPETFATKLCDFANDKKLAPGEIIIVERDDSDNQRVLDFIFYSR